MQISVEFVTTGWFHRTLWQSQDNNRATIIDSDDDPPSLVV